MNGSDNGHLGVTGSGTWSGTWSDTWKVTAVTLTAFFLYYLPFEYFFTDLRAAIDSLVPFAGVSHVIAYVIVGLPLLAGAFVIGPRGRVLSSLGLAHPVLPAAGLALFFTLPMFAGYAALFEWDSELTASRLVRGVLAAGFFEELYFRGFLFGLVYRFTRLGFVPAIALGALLFGLGHLHQSRDVDVLIGVFISTFSGAVFFAWLYCEWRFNLWVPIFLHMFMNLSWMLFDVADNAMGGQAANVFRVATIVLSITFTVLYKRHHGQPLEVNRKTLWFKSGMWGVGARGQPRQT